MKKILFAIFSLALVLITTTAFVGTDASPEKATAPDVIMKDYLHNAFNAELAARFELQFAEMFTEVTDIDAHQNESGDYYYTVYGSNPAGDQVVDYFKTTADEVESKTYNYIEMTARTMTWPPRRKCREATSFPFPSGTFCHPDNPGYICGIQVNPWGGCFLY